MEWIWEILKEAAWTLAGVLISALVAKLGTGICNFLEEKSLDRSVREIIKSCVEAVEMMDQGQSGEEKLGHATTLAKNLLGEKGICLSDERLRVILESCLASLSGAFAKT